MKRLLTLIRLFTLAAALLLAPAVGHGQGRIAPPAPLPPPVIKLPPGEQPVRLTRFDVRAVVAGLHAETTTTMTFFNPNGRILAGELEFPLPDGAAVSGYGLDIGGRMVDGVVVSRQKARVVLETEMRRRVDPGIVEHVRGNSFRTRIYPIPARGERTVSVTYVSPLSLSAGEAAYHLPLPREENLPSLNLKVEVAKGPVRPELGGFGNLSLTEWDDRWSAEATLENVTPGDDLYVRLPQLPPRIVTVEEHDGSHFVAVSDVTPPAQGGATPPARIAVAWDASGSRDGKALRRDREFLSTLLKKWGDCVIDLVVFRNRPEDVRTFTVRGGDAGDLVEYLAALPSDGGTDLAALDLRRSALPDGGASAWLLFTDGLHTLGDGLPTFGGVPVHVISSDSRRDPALQRFLAAATGGLLIDLTVTDTADAVVQLTSPLPVLIGVEASAGTIADVQYRSAPGAGRTAVYGRLLADGELTLVYGAGGREISRRTIAVKRGGAAKGRVIARAWAASRVEELSVFPEENGDAMLEIGRRYGLVTPGASLIVLENLNQYLEHEITPPESWPEMREQYLAALKERRSRETQRRESKIEQVLSWWKARITWWERDFPRTADLRGRVINGKDQVPRPSLSRTAPSPEAPAVEASSQLRALRGDDMPAERMAEEDVSFSKAKRKKEGARSTSAAISIKAWDPRTPYLSALKEVPDGETYSAYLDQRPEYAGSPAFYLDCAGYLMSRDRSLALRVLSNLAELKIDDASLMRVFAWRLHEAGELDRAVEILARVRRLRPEEPQSHRDLALLMAERMERDGRVADGVRAAELFNEVILGQWQRFQQVEVIVLMELNRLLKALDRLDGEAAALTDFVDDRLRRLLDVDVRIVMSWDADNTDIDLHVIEPSGEEAYYGHNVTTIGGHVSRDFTQGYGPEEYLLRRAMPGTYRIRCRYYGSRQQTLVGPATVTATVITNFGRPDEKRQRITLRLDKVRDMVDIGAVTIGGADQAVETGELRREQISALSAGMSLQAVEESLGKPERVDGGGLTVLVYRLVDGRLVRLGFGPGLLWAREVHTGAERDIPLRPR